MKFGLLATGYKGATLLNKLNTLPEFVVSYYNNEPDELEKIVKWCASNKVKFFSKKNFNEDMFETVDKVFLVGWQYLVKTNLEKCLVLHDSFLPERRGFCPTVSALIDGQSYLGASCFIPTEDGDGYPDYGIVYAREKKSINHPISIREAFDVVVDLYADIINNFDLSKKPIDVNYEDSTFSIWRDNNDLNIDWQKSSSSIVRQVLATGIPYQGSSTIYNHHRIRILDAIEIPDINVLQRQHHCGKILKLVDKNPIVICGEGLIQITSAKYDTPIGQDVIFDSIRKRLG